MVVEKNNKFEDYKFKKGNLNFAVVGHVEWINFLKINQNNFLNIITNTIRQKQEMESQIIEA